VALARAVELAPDNPAYRGAQATATEALRLPQARAGFDAALALAGDDYVSLAGAGQGPAAGRPRRRAHPAAQGAGDRTALRPGPGLACGGRIPVGWQAAAFDSWRARLSDPRPLPWQVESILRNDGGEPEAAIAAAREALAAALPQVAQPLASDAQGSANLGKAWAISG
jgi:hypothetical protein